MTLFENMILFPESCPWLIIMTNSSLFYLLLFIFYLAIFLLYWTIRWRILELNIGHVAFKWSLRVTCLMCQFGDQPNGMTLKWLTARPMTVTGHGQNVTAFQFSIRLLSRVRASYPIRGVVKDLFGRSIRHISLISFSNMFSIIRSRVLWPLEPLYAVYAFFISGF